MVMVKVPKGTRRVRRSHEKPPRAWTILLRLDTYGLGKGEAEIGWTERREDGWRGYTADATDWHDEKKWLPVVRWLVDSYVGRAITTEPVAAGEAQHIAQQHDAALAGDGERLVTDDMDWLTEPAQPAPDEPPF